jgi:excisionase family DNA binding protein
MPLHTAAAGTECRAYTASDLSKLLAVSTPTIRRLARDNLIPGRLPVGWLRFRKDVIDRWLAGEEVAHA